LLSMVELVLAETQASRQSTVASQQNLARYIRPYEAHWQASGSYEHRGIND
jgi:hypothetical protein